MELEQLHRAWHELDARLNALETQQDVQAERARMTGIQRRLRGAVVRRAMALIIWLGITVAAAQFWVAHRHVTHLLAAGLALHVYAMAGLILSAIQLVMLAGVRADAPVLATQQRMATFMRMRIVTGLALGLPWWFLWFVCPLVGVQWMTGIDLYALAPAWFGWNLAIGVAGIAGSLWLAHRLARHPPTSPLLRQMIEDMSGRSLHRVRNEIDALARFADAD